MRQEFWGLLLAHFAIRDLMQEAADKGQQDPDQLSYVHAVRLVRRKLAIAVAIPPRARKAFYQEVLDELLEEQVVSSRGHGAARAESSAR